jgi:hypothetical protein
LPFGKRFAAAMKAGWFYARWYPKQALPWIGFSGRPKSRLLRGHLRYASVTSRVLARRLFHAMVVYGPGLERQQVLLGRFVDIGTELFAMAASCYRADAWLAQGKQAEESIQLVDFFCQKTRLRIGQYFGELRRNVDKPGYRIAQKVLAGKLPWLTGGIVGGSADSEPPSLRAE